MPAPELAWKVYQVPAHLGGAAGPLEAAVPREEQLRVEIPDLREFPGPRDKARILLETAAEVEHALVVEYLYAAFSLKSSQEVSDPAQQSALQDWFDVLRLIARQEMGHLMTAQNLLLAIGLRPNLEREDFPPRKDLYPFKLHLEPLSQRSLAKYVAAEAPQDPTGIDDIIELATESAGTTVHRVGTIYGLLGVVFSTEQSVTAGGSGSDPWGMVLRRLAAAAHQQSPASSWHLGDDAIDPQTLAFQGHTEHWSGGDVTIHLIGDRAAALEAIRDVAEQGEGPTDSGKASHFDRYRRMYRGGDGIPPFPPADAAWTPTHAVPKNPRPDAIDEPRTRRWAQLADLRYALLLGFIEHHLLTSDADDRANLAGWAFAEMFGLRRLAEKLVTLPQGSGVAALPFTLPASLHLPATEPERWQLQRARTTAAIEHVRQMQAADPADADDAILSGLVQSDTANLGLMHGEGPPPVPTMSFARDVMPMFRPVDIQHMRARGLDLTDFDAVRSKATLISKRLKGIGGRPMPPPPDAPLTAAQIERFDTWIAEGFPP
jgi:Ferritin-like